ncbi:MAG: ABC transporter ATP-binding protein [Verrucomicrobiales bacterium]|nr:ABC transporter ATP-binding protein [Verrucomicrobiales bacterium]
MNVPSPSSSTAIISITALSRRFGSKQALDEVNLHVPRGCVFGLVGENGAGKTTLIKHILGLLKPQAGSVRVFGADPVADSVGVLGLIGYLSEQRDLPGWMRVDELLRYTRAFYPNWDPGYAEELRRQFGLDPAARVKNLSQGQQAKAGLALALAFRPDLLLLDEPSSGLDPIVRRDILEAIIRTVADEGRTVFFSSHLLDEIERISDQIAMIRAGRIILSGRLDDLKKSHRQIRVRFEQAQATPPRFEFALGLQGGGRDWTLLSTAEVSRVTAAAAAIGGRILGEETPSLDEIFVAHAAQRPGSSEANSSL